MTPQVVYVTADTGRLDGPASVDVIYRPDTGENDMAFMVGEIVPGETGEAELMMIEEEIVPLAAAKPGYWALINLIAALLTLIGGIILLADRIMRRKHSGEEDGNETAPPAEESTDAQEDAKEKRFRMWIPGILTAAVSVIVFFLTEDLTNLMRFVDRWTVLMVLLLLAEAVFLLLEGRKRFRREENEEAETA